MEEVGRIVCGGCSEDVIFSEGEATIYNTKHRVVTISHPVGMPLTIRIMTSLFEFSDLNNASSIITSTLAASLVNSDCKKYWSGVKTDVKNLKVTDV